MTTHRSPRFVPRRIAALLILAAPFFLSGCAYTIISGGRVNERKAAKIERGIQDLRHLRFKHHVPVVVKSPDEIEEMIEADLMRDTSDEQLAAEGTAGAMIGLYPAGINLKAAELKLLKSQIAGFYDLHGKRMVLVEGAQGAGFWLSATEFMMQRDIVGEMILAHELTHALQDQNFGLAAKLDRVKDDDDRMLALKSVAEGDATLAGFAYIMGGMSDSTADTVIGGLNNLPAALAAESPGTPRGISEPLLFQYSEGVKFVAEAYRRGGWPAVDALYKNPPQSSREIIDPARYFNDPKAPAPQVKLAGYEKILPGWKKIEDDTMGELMLRVILENTLGEHSPGVELASRWAGDQIAILTRSKETKNLTPNPSPFRRGELASGDGFVSPLSKRERGTGGEVELSQSASGHAIAETTCSVIWLIAFADANSAHRFETEYGSKLNQIAGGASQHRLAAAGKAVLIVLGSAASYFDTLAPPVWKTSRIEPSAHPRRHFAVAP